MEKKKSRRLWITLLAAFTLRAIVYFYLCDRTNMNGLMRNPQYGYIDEAENILYHHNWFMALYNGNWRLSTVHGKGYSLLLALIMLVFPNQYMMVMHLIMIIADISVCVFVYDICEHLFHKEKIARCSAWLWALSPVAIFNCIQDLPDGFSCFFIGLIVWLYYRNLEHPLKRYAVLGLVMGIANTFRSEFLLLTVVVLICDVLRTWSIRKIFVEWLVCIACFFMILIPRMVYTYAVTGNVMISSTSAWGSAYQGIGEKEDNAWGIRLGDVYVNEVALEQGYDGYWLPESEEYFKQQFLTYVKENPKEYLDIIVQYRLPKAFMPVQTTFINMNRIYDWNAMVEESRNHVLPVVWLGLSRFAAIVSGRIGQLFSFIRLIAMIAFTCIMIRKKRFGECSILFALWLYFPVTISLLKQIEARNVLTNLPIMIIGMSYILMKILRKE